MIEINLIWPGATRRLTVLNQTPSRPVFVFQYLTMSFLHYNKNSRHVDISLQISQYYKVHMSGLQHFPALKSLLTPQILDVHWRAMYTSDGQQNWFSFPNSFHLENIQLLIFPHLLFLYGYFLLQGKKKLLVHSQSLMWHYTAFHIVLINSLTELLDV